MRLHTENSSVRFIAISLLVFLAVSFVGYWYWSPYYAADQIKNAVESGDTTKMSKFIDFPKVRLNIQRQINNQIDIKLQEFQQMPVSSHNQIDLYSLISGKNKLSKYASHEEHGQLKDVVPQVKDDEPCDVEVEKKYGDDFNRFYVTLTGKDEPEDKVLITLSREGFFFWRVTNVLLPFGA